VKEMKKIAMSLSMIAFVSMLAVGATGAYFSDTKAVQGNTFATGTVKIGDVSNMPVNVTNLIPGVPQTTMVGFKYTGSTNADVYVGNTGNPSTPAFYLADVLKVKIMNHSDNSIVYYNGLANGLVSNWKAIASDIGAGWQYYDVTFTLNSSVGNEYQEKTNTNTVFLFHAVQTGGGAPATPPLTTPY